MKNKEYAIIALITLGTSIIGCTVATAYIAPSLAGETESSFNSSSEKEQIKNNLDQIVKDAKNIEANTSSGAIRIIAKRIKNTAIAIANILFIKYSKGEQAKTEVMIRMSGEIMSYAKNTSGVDVRIKKTMDEIYSLASENRNILSGSSKKY